MAKLNRKMLPANRRVLERLALDLEEAAEKSLASHQRRSGYNTVFDPDKPARKALQRAATSLRLSLDKDKEQEA